MARRAAATGAARGKRWVCRFCAADAGSTWNPWSYVRMWRHALWHVIWDPR